MTILYSKYHFDQALRVWRTQDKQNFPYSDGDSAETYLYDSLKKVQDLSVHSNELRSYQKNWSSQYHLSLLRSNLLRPFSDTVLKGANVLELGCGCGAITRFLGETAKNVVAVEGSCRRASIAAERCRDLENVKCLVDSIQELPTDMGLFDVVTVIGVLEYSRLFFSGTSPELEFLKKARSYLKPNGVLILAIENKIGLKYFAGIAEDHVGIPWYGVMDLYAQDGVATFTRKELLGLCHDAGFVFSEQFIPVPDYKLPKAIIHTAGVELDELEFSKAQIFKTVNDARTYNAMYNMNSAWQPICDGGLLHEMADSLCFVLHTHEKNEETALVWNPRILATHYGRSFSKGSLKEVCFCKDAGKIHMERKYLYPEMLAVELPSVQHCLENEPYLRGQLLSEILSRAMQQPSWTVENICVVLESWHKWLLTHALDDTGTLPTSMIDAAPFNVMVINNDFTYFDKEWAYEGTLPIEAMLIRSLFNTFRQIDMVAIPKASHTLNYFNLICTVLQRFGYKVDNAFMSKHFEAAFVLDRALNIAAPRLEQMKELFLRLNIYDEYRTCQNNQQSNQPSRSKK